MRKAILFLVALVLLLTTLGAGVSCSSGTTQETTQSQSAEEFYKTHPISIVVPYGPGGGADFAGRVFAAHWYDVTGGTAQVINMPGGEAVVGINYVWEAKPDGLTIGVCPSFSQLASPYLSKNSARKFEIDKLGYLGWFAPEPQVASIGANSKYNTIADLQAAKGLKAPTVGSGISEPEVGVILALGLDAKLITGYSSGAEVALACARGEGDFEATAAGVLKSFVDQGLLKAPFVALSTTKPVLFPDIPLIRDVATNWTADTERYFQIYSLLQGGKPLYATPGIPADRLQYLRESFDKIMALPGFKTMAELRYGKMDPSATGQQVEQIAKDFGKVPEADITWFNDKIKSFQILK